MDPTHGNTLIESAPANNVRSMPAIQPSSNRSDFPASRGMKTWPRGSLLRAAYFQSGTACLATGGMANGSGGESVAGFQVEQPLDTLLRLRVTAKQRRLPEPAAAQEEPIQQTLLQTLEFHQC